MPVPYRRRMAQLIEAGGGLVEDDRYVTRPGVLLVNVSAPTPEAERLLDSLGLDADLVGVARVAAFDARVTYLNFPDADERTGTEYLRGVTETRGHTSVTARAHASVLFAGISLEDSIELVAGRAGRSARLTSSDTSAQGDTLYCIRGTPEERAAQRAFIERFLELRRSLALPDRYLRNLLNLGNRATLLHMGMVLEDWHQILRSRLRPEGNEPAVREAFARAGALLHARFPFIIQESYA